MKTLAFLTLGLGVLAGAAAAQSPDSAAWNLSLPKAPQDTAYLTYAVPESGRLRLNLSCRVKSGQVLAMFDVEKRLAVKQRGQSWVDNIGRPAPWPVSVTVMSLTQKTTLRGLALPNAMTGGSTVQVEVSTLAPVVAEWRNTAVLRLDALDEVNAQPAAAKGLISRFLRACG